MYIIASQRQTMSRGRVAYASDFHTACTVTFTDGELLLGKTRSALFS